MAEVPNLDYTSRDYTGMRESLLEYAAQHFPDWKPSSEGDFGVLMVELMAYTTDVLSYYVDRAQLEAYLSTASQRSSVLQIAQTLGYRPGNGAPAFGRVTIKTDVEANSVVVPKGTRLATEFVEALDTHITYETDYEIAVPGGGETVTVDVTEGETRTDEVTGEPLLLGQSTGLPDQNFRLPHARVYLDTVQVFVHGQPWRYVDSLLDASAYDEVFTTRQDADGYTYVLLGDSINGTVPTLGLDVRTVYRTGVGASGNIAPQRVYTIHDSSLYGVSVYLDDLGRPGSTEMTGGADPESTEQIRRNAPRVFRTQKRAVTTEDFRNLALSLPGVAKASVVSRSFSSVTVYITGPDGKTPTESLKAQTGDLLQSYAMTGVSVTVNGPTLIGVNLGSVLEPISVEVWPNFSRSAVQYQVEKAIRARFSFNQVDLGGVFTVSDLYKTMMDVPGVRFVKIPVMARVDAAQTNTNDMTFKPWEIPVINGLTLTSTGGLG